MPYTENRVHPQKGYGRPGWLRCEQFGAGMITGWGAHHMGTVRMGEDPDTGAWISDAEVAEVPYTAFAATTCISGPP